MSELKKRNVMVQLTQEEHEMLMTLKIQAERESGQAVSIRQVVVYALTEKYIRINKRKNNV